MILISREEAHQVLHNVGVLQLTQGPHFLLQGVHIFCHPACHISILADQHLQTQGPGVCCVAKGKLTSCKKECAFPFASCSICRLALPEILALPHVPQQRYHILHLAWVMQPHSRWGCSTISRPVYQHLVVQPCLVTRLKQVGRGCPTLPEMQDMVPLLRYMSEQNPFVHMFQPIQEQGGWESVNHAHFNIP